MILINKINLDDKSDCHYNNDWFQGKPISTFHCITILHGSTFKPYLLQWILIPMQIASANTCKLIYLNPLFTTSGRLSRVHTKTQANSGRKVKQRIRIVRVA